MTDPRTPSEKADAWIRGRGRRSTTVTQQPGESLDQAIRRAAGRDQPPAQPNNTTEEPRQ